ncbi:MAG: acetylglutamate kinase [Gammaproteobacteria bacterium]
MNAVQASLSRAAPVDLRTLARYVRRFRGRTFVVKIGGDILTDAAALRSVCEQLSLLWSFSIPIVVVHGGGPQLDALCQKLGVPVLKRDGRRLTDAAGLQAAKQAFGAAQTDLLAALRAAGLSSIGLSGVAAGLVTAHSRSDGEGTEWGFVGDIDTVNPAPLQELLGHGHVPVIAPLSGDDAGGVFNTNADSLAAAVAVALHAEKLVYLMRAPGLLADAGDPTSLLPAANSDELDAMVAAGVLRGGMYPKAAAAKQALAGGVAAVHCVSGFIPDALLVEVFTNEGSGTMLTAGDRCGTAVVNAGAQA